MTDVLVDVSQSRPGSPYRRECANHQAVRGVLAALPPLGLPAGCAGESAWTLDRVHAGRRQAVPSVMLEGDTYGHSHSAVGFRALDH